MPRYFMESFPGNMKSLDERRENLSLEAKGRRLLGLTGSMLFGATLLLLGLTLYAAEQIIRANPQLIPVKAQIRAFTNSREYRPVPDRDIGFLGPPHLRTWVSSQDFKFLRETDAHGFPNRMPWPKTADILVLGDSLIEGIGVGIDHQFSSLVGQAIPNKRILNLGIAGAGPNRQLRAYRMFGASFRPDLVISCIYLAADLDNQLHFDSWLQEGTKADYNQFRLDLNGRLHPRSFWTGVQRKSYVAGKLTELALRWWGVPDYIRFSTGSEVLLDIDNLRSRANPLDRQDRRLLSILESLKDIQALAQSREANFVVVLIPSKEEIYGAPFMPEVMKPARTVEQRLREEGLSVLSLYETVWVRGKHQSTFFPHDIHLNAYGNQIMADGLVNWVKQTKLLPSEKRPVETSKSRIDSHEGSF
jgi:SGNH hydrolase-like domain, acetyltransferase AlgX